MNNEQDQKQLPEIFRELQQSRFEQEINEKLHVKESSKRKKRKEAELAQKYEYEYRNMGKELPKADVLDFNVKKASIITMCMCAIVLSMVSKSYIFANDDKENAVEDVKIAFETNENAINLTQIVSQNTAMVEAKDYVTEVRDVEYETVYLEDTSLQKDEQVVAQEGVNGKEEVKVVKTYKQGEFVEETILERTTIEEPIKAVVHVGTSEFLSTYNVHLGDTLYVLDNTILREGAYADAQEICTIGQYLDVKLLEVLDDWCKVAFDEQVGYVKASNLTSESFNPEIVEKNRIQRILVNVNESMSINKSSGLTLDDFKKVLSGNSSDVNKVIESNAEAFYNADTKYNINGIFLAGIAINESAWGTSNIANTKKNLFGYGSYDNDPLNSSFTFETYEEGIDLVAKVMAKHYLNQAGTEIYDGEIATGKYYNGATVESVNIRYASDENWHAKVYSYMEYLYNKLK